MERESRWSQLRSPNVNLNKYGFKVRRDRLSATFLVPREVQSKEEKESVTNVKLKHTHTGQ